MITKASATVPRSTALPARGRFAPGAVVGHTGFTVARYFSTYAFAAAFPLAAGMLFFGWRAILLIVGVLACTLAATLVWRKVGTRGYLLRPAHLLWMSILLAMMLPAHLASRAKIDGIVSWPIIPAAALLLVILWWGLGGIGAGRFHPAVIVYLVLAALFFPHLQPRAVLHRRYLVMGDLQDQVDPQQRGVVMQSWQRLPPTFRHPAIVRPGVNEPLSRFTRGFLPAGQTRTSLEQLLRDDLPPLEDVIIGARPGPLGETSAVAIIIAGLFLLYRGLIDFRIPLMICAASWLALLVMPIPRVVDRSQPLQYHWLIGRLHSIGWGTGITFANYELLGGPILFVAFFLAGSPLVRPLTHKGRTMYAMLIGVLAGGFQLYVSISLGAYLAMSVVACFTPWFDRRSCVRPLV